MLSSSSQKKKKQQCNYKLAANQLILSIISPLNFMHNGLEFSFVGNISHSRKIFSWKQSLLKSYCSRKPWFIMGVCGNPSKRTT